MRIKCVLADRCPLLIIERTSNRWILCLTASLDFRGSFNAILSTLHAQVDSERQTIIALHSTSRYRQASTGVKDVVPHLLSSSQCSARALSSSLSSSMLRALNCSALPAMLRQSGNTKARGGRGDWRLKVQRTSSHQTLSCLHPLRPLQVSLPASQM